MVIDVIHADAISASVEGAYDDNDEDAVLRLTHGHGKENLLALRQFPYRLAVTKEGFPVIGKALDHVQANQRLHRDDPAPAVGALL